MESMERFEQAFEAARSFRPMSENEIKALLAKTEKAASKGEFELFKTSSVFDRCGNLTKATFLGTVS
jgi:hypothetical protein